MKIARYIRLPNSAKLDNDCFGIYWRPYKPAKLSSALVRELISDNEAIKCYPELGTVANAKKRFGQGHYFFRRVWEYNYEKLPTGSIFSKALPLP